MTQNIQPQNRPGQQTNPGQLNPNVKPGQEQQKSTQQEQDLTKKQTPSRDSEQQQQPEDAYNSKGQNQRLSEDDEQLEDSEDESNSQSTGKERSGQRDDKGQDYGIKR